MVPNPEKGLEDKDREEEMRDSLDSLCRNSCTTTLAAHILRNLLADSNGGKRLPVVCYECASKLTLSNPDQPLRPGLLQSTPPVPHPVAESGKWIKALDGRENADKFAISDP